MPAQPFTFNGYSTFVPRTLVRERVAQSNVTALLPFGKIFMAGAADGGNGGGTIYRGTLDSLRLILRGGNLLKALERAVGVGPTQNIIVAVCGTKTPSTYNFVVSSVTQATLTSGDQGSWTLGISFTLVAGTTGGVAFTISWTDAFGNTNTVGGKGTAFDNLMTYNALAAAIAANAILTPPATSGLPPIVTMTVTVNSLPVTLTLTNLAGGTGNGSASLVFMDYKPGIDAMVNETYDVGHLVNCNDSSTYAATIAYLDSQAAAVEVLGNLRRNVHQLYPTGLTSTATKQTNSAALSAAAVAAANILNYKRSNLVVQQVYAPDPDTGVYAYVDAAPYYVGRLVLDASGDCGPATPSTGKPMSTCADVNYAILEGNDLENAIGNGVVVFRRGTEVVPGGVTVWRSVTTAPLSPSGQQWPFFEVSALRAADGTLSNVKAQIDYEIGEGSTKPLLVHLIGQVKKILGLAIAANWITQYDANNIAIVPGGGSGTGYILKYSAAPTLPLNNVGVDALTLPFQVQLASTSGVVNG